MKCKTTIRLFLKIVAFALVQLAILNLLHNNDPIIIETGNEYNYSITTLMNTSYPGVKNYTRYATARLRLLPLKKVKPLMPELGPVINDVTSFKYPITIPPCGITKNQSVFIAVISATENFKKRKLVRLSWKKHIDLVLQKGRLGKIHFGFVLGRTENNSTQKKIEEESQTYGDILQIEMLDFYRNLPLKMAGLLNWANINCPEIDFVIKIDDDMYLNVHVLVHFVRSYHQSGKMTIFGQSPSADGFSNNWGPNRDTGAWQITVDEWPWNTYPNYVNGPAYLIHGSAILPLLAAVQTTPMISFEDVYLTGICAEKAGVRTQYSSDWRNSMIRDWYGPGQCDADKYLTWNSREYRFNYIDNFYGGSLSCKPKESVKFNFRSEKSVWF